MRLAEETELHQDIDLIYENIESISAKKQAEFFRQKVATHAATSKEMLCLEKYYFDKLFLTEVGEHDKSMFWNRGSTYSAHVQPEYRERLGPLRANLPGVTTRIDEILAGASLCGPVEAVETAFADHLDQATFKAIEERYPTHQRDSTND